MSPFGISRKKGKDQAKTDTHGPPPVQKTILDELCGGDKDLLEALSRTIMVNPEATLKEGIDSHVEKAQQYEKSGDIVRARVSYQVAGEIALYEGNAAQTQEFFKKAAEVDPNYSNKKLFDYFGKKKNAERAVSVAKEFYQKTGKRTEA
jgi:hypothetical protein